MYRSDSLAFIMMTKRSHVQVMNGGGTPQCEGRALFFDFHLWLTVQPAGNIFRVTLAKVMETFISAESLFKGI